LSLTIQQRFLLLFADYRQAREENTRVGDEVLMLRGQIEVERTRFDVLMNKFCEREVGLNNRLMAAKFPIEVHRERKEGPPPEPGAKEWKQDRMTDFNKVVADIAATGPLAS
jgi:hypothetical protein